MKLPYKVSKQFQASANFLRVREKPSDGQCCQEVKVKYTIPKGELDGLILIVDEDSSCRNWFRVAGFRTKSGPLKYEPGWVVKSWGECATLVPRATMRARSGPTQLATPTPSDGSPDDDARSDITHHAETIHASRGQSTGLNGDYVGHVIENPDNETFSTSHGDIAWTFMYDMQLLSPPNLEGKHLRVIKRQVVVSEPGHGLDIVRKMESDCFIERNDISPDIVLFFLHSLKGSEKAHQSHGYTALWKHKGMTLMYKQVPRNVHAKGANKCHTLPQSEVEALAKDMYPKPE